MLNNQRTGDQRVSICQSDPISIVCCGFGVSSTDVTGLITNLVRSLSVVDVSRSHHANCQGREQSKLGMTCVKDDTALLHFTDKFTELQSTLHYPDPKAQVAEKCFSTFSCL